MLVLLFAELFLSYFSCCYSCNFRPPFTTDEEKKITKSVSWPQFTNQSQYPLSRSPIQNQYNGLYAHFMLFGRMRCAERGCGGGGGLSIESYPINRLSYRALMVLLKAIGQKLATAKIEKLKNIIYCDSFLFLLCFRSFSLQCSEMMLSNIILKLFIFHKMKRIYKRYELLILPSMI